MKEGSKSSAATKLPVRSSTASGALFSEVMRSSNSPKPGRPVISKSPVVSSTNTSKAGLTAGTPFTEVPCSSISRSLSFKLSGKDS